MQVTKNKVEYTEHVVELDVGQVKQIMADHIRYAKNLDAKPEDIEFDLANDLSSGDSATVVGVTATILKRGKVQKNGNVAASKVVSRPFPLVVSPIGPEDDGFPKDEALAKKAKSKTTKEEKPAKKSPTAKVQADAEKQSKKVDKTPKKAKKTTVPDEPDED